MMRAGTVLAAAIVAMAGGATVYAENDHNKTACEEWCRQKAGEFASSCDFCSTKSACGPRAYRLARFEYQYGGTTWHACHGPESQLNKEHCESWCAEKPGCVKCSTVPTCGVGFRHLRSFSGTGENWYACAQTDYGEASQSNREECEAWCKANSSCVKCMDKLGCGLLYESFKTFGGRGENWYACRRK